jgi:hypothetical protein
MTMTFAGGLGLDGSREADARRAAEDDDGAAFKLRRRGLCLLGVGGIGAKVLAHGGLLVGATAAPMRAKLAIHR